MFPTYHMLHIVVTYVRIVATVFVQVTYMSLIHMCSFRPVMCPCGH